MNYLELTTGSITGKLLKFSLPILAANLLQSAYSIVDMMIVGRLIGSAGLVAVSNASMLVFVTNSICIALSMGGNVLIAQYKGRRDLNSQQETLDGLFLVSLAASAIIASLGILTSRAVFKAMDVPAEAFHNACGYMNIQYAGMLFVFGYNAVYAVLRGLSDAKNPLYLIAAATVINVVLDVVFIKYLRSGLNGAAYATVLSQAAVCILGLVVLGKHSGIKVFQVHVEKSSWGKVCNILKIGVQSMIQWVVINFSYLIITAMLNSYGVIIAAAAGIGLKISTLAAIPTMSVGQGLITAVAQNLGAGYLERTQNALKKAFKISLLLVSGAVLAVQLFAPELVGFFDADPWVINEGIIYLFIYCSFNSYIFTVMFIFDSFAIGVGDSVFAMFNSILEAVVVRLLLCWLFAVYADFGHRGIYYALALSPISPAIIGYVYYKKGLWKRRRIKI